MVAILLVAFSAGLSNLAGAVAIGISGVDARIRLRVGLIFGLFESLMPIVGLLLGRSLAGLLGEASGPIGGVLLALTGIYTIVAAMRAEEGDDDAIVASKQNWGRLLITGLVLSIDNLVIGFALGAYHVSLVVAAIIIGAVSVCLSLIGLEFGARLGEKLGEASEFVGGLVLIGVGAALGFGVL